MAKGKFEEWLEEDNLKKLEAWARDGLTDEQLARNIGISVRALYNWKNKYVQIFQALKRGKEIVDIEVENALLKKALGYNYEEQKEIQRVVDGKKYHEKVLIKKHIPGDTTAQIFWLKNRKPVEWRDKQEVENINRNIELTIGDWQDED